MRIEFIVPGRPPRKRGEKSMWARSDEAPSVAILRECALQARKAAGLVECLSELVALRLDIFVPKNKLESVGDLDNFITGVCDGLQAANSSVLPYLHEEFKRPGREAINPKHPLLIDNDSKIISILAHKVPIDSDSETYYTVAIETF